MKIFCPGRVNLLGEHLDYNGGWTMPIAIPMGIELTVTPHTHSSFLFTSDGHPSVDQIAVSPNMRFDPALGWANYPIGILSKLIREIGELPNGFHFHYESNLPEGSGLSSSAAIEATTAFAYMKILRQEADPKWLAALCKEVENEFIGVGCGIMDQLAVCASVQAHALLIKCDTLELSYLPFETDRYSLVIMDTRKPRQLIASKYNERLNECLEILKIIQTVSDVQHLAHAEMIHTELLSDVTLKRRARHVISEQLRVKEAIKALKYNDLFTLGKLFNASHQSLKINYEVTGNELDVLVETAQMQTGCLGARMTGAGFGGCAIALVDEIHLSKFTEIVSEQYEKQTGYSCNMYITRAEDGVRLMN